MRVFNVDISRKGISPVVQVTEHDAMSRFFTLVLRDGAADYEEPEGATYSVWYKTADSHGWYDTITEPDNGTHPAVVADGNAYTIEIAEQATTSCGELALCITAPDGYQLTVSGIITRSADIPGYDGEEVENYYNVFITRMQENAARAENAADIAVAYGATVEVDEDAQQLNITHHSDTEGGVGWLFGSAVTNSAEGSVAAFADGANDVAVKSLIANIMPVQSGSGDPSPTNVREISGRTGLTVVRTGKNLMPRSTFDRTVGGITGKANADGSVHVTGTATAETSLQIYTNFVLPAGTYIWSSGLDESFSTYDTYLSSSGTIARGNSNAPGPMFTLTESRDVSCNVRVRGGQTVDITVKPMVRVVGTSDTFEPYTAQTYPVSWQTQAGAIYGGTLDVVSGVLMVTHAAVQIKDKTWTYDSAYTRFSSSFAANGIAVEPTRTQKLVCDAFAPVTTDPGIANVPNNSIYNGGTNRILYVKTDTVNTAANFVSTYGNYHIVFPLATPTTYRLTPTEVKTLLGGNSIYTDAGSVSVDYIADTKLYIDNKVAELQALILEN